VIRGMRSFLFGKWFFALLFVVSTLDVAADVAERLHAEFWHPLNALSIIFSVVVAILAGWMFFDLHTRRWR
jgi:hypothetical protein